MSAVHDYVVAELRQRPQASYADIARRCACKESYVRHVAYRHGLERVGQHGGVPWPWPGKTSERQ